MTDAPQPTEEPTERVAPQAQEPDSAAPQAPPPQAPEAPAPQAPEAPAPQAAAPQAPAPDWPAGDTASSQARPGMQANVEYATALTEELLDRGAPWSAKTSWRIVLTEGVVSAIVGLLFILKPLGGSATTLQIVGLILLVGSLLTAFQLWRHHLRPDLEQLASFRSGSGVTVGLVVIVATFFTPVTEAVTATLAVVVGIGFFIFGVTGIGSSFIRRELDAPLPMASLVANAVLALAGLVLVFAGAGGSGSVDTVFNLLGVLLIAGGLALAGYAYLLLQEDARR